MLSTLTAPLVVEGVNTSHGRKNLVFLVGSDDTVYALDADSGKIFWQKRFPQQAHAAADRNVAVLEYPERDAGNR